MEEQVVIIYVATGKHIMDVPSKEVRKFNAGLLEFIKDKYPQILQNIAETGELKPDTEEFLKKAITEYKAVRV
jgi:F-type H+-transporting ATPase subunit alpha